MIALVLIVVRVAAKFFREIPGFVPLFTNWPPIWPLMRCGVSKGPTKETYAGSDRGCVGRGIRRDLRPLLRGNPGNPQRAPRECGLDYCRAGARADPSDHGDGCYAH